MNMLGKKKEGEMAVVEERQKNRRKTLSLLPI